LIYNFVAEFAFVGLSGKTEKGPPVLWKILSPVAV
jgi:hypothetical protein